MAFDWAEQKMHEAAMALPPSDFGSHRAVKAAGAVLRQETEQYRDLLKRALAELELHNGDYHHVSDHMLVEIHEVLAKPFGGQP